MTSYTSAFIWGALTSACGVAALRLLIFFAAAFAALALNWLVLGLSDPGYEARLYAYYIRPLGFVLIIVGIIDRNRRAGR